MYPAVIEVTSHDNYILSVVFDNGERGILDMKPFLNFGVFQRLKDQHVFERVRISFDTIAWDSGIDLDPEFVYANSRRVEGKKDFAAKSFSTA